MQVAVKNRLQQMGNYDFEHFVGDLWERMGWTCEVSQESVDAGVDVVAKKSNPYPQKELIQAKRYGPNTTVGGPDIQQYASLKHQESGVDSVVVVTSNSFTRAAEERANELNVKLVDGDGLVSMIDDLNAEDLVKQYASGVVKTSQTHAATQNTRFRGEGVTAEPNEDGFLHKITGARNWHRVLLKSVGLAFVSLFAGGWLLDSSIAVLSMIGSIFSIIWAVSIVAIVISLYLDIRYVRSHSSWNPTTWQYLVGLLVFYITIPVYLYRRRKMMGL